MMIILQMQGITKAFGENEILTRINLAVNEKERVGLVGINGSGKTTLMRCLTGELQPDEGEISVASGLSLGCLEQLSASRPDLTAWDVIMESFSELIEKRQQMRDLEAEMGQPRADLEKLMEKYARINAEYELANGYACETMARRILTGLGFSQDEFNQALDTFSGGQKTRLNLGRLLALNPDVLLLDEPTNHLDTSSVEWLEDFLHSYPGTVVVVSHDRMFLDRTATRIAELRGGELKSYQGNYSTYLQKKALDDLADERAYQKQQDYIRKTEEYIRRFKAGIKSKQARGRQSQLARLERLSGPNHEHRLGKQHLKMNQESGHNVLTIKGVQKSFEENKVLEDIDLAIEKGDRIALIGPNGCGKTTLLKIIVGQLQPDQGEVKLGSRVNMAYFSQEHADLNPLHTVLEEIFVNFDLTLEEARTCLGGMLFSEDDVFKKVADLSGGERGRLSLLKIILSGANFLLLDEPTNHLDIASCQVVEKLLADYEGTILMVSHDRYFIDQVAQRVIAIEEGQARYYWGNYSYYHEKKQAANNGSPTKTEAKNRTGKSDAEQRLETKEKERIRRKLERELAAVETSILETEGRKTELEEYLSDPVTYNDEEKARLYIGEHKETEHSLISLYDQWELLHGELERII